MPVYNIKAPALPIQPDEYDRSQMDQFQNALRLYFNRLDQFNAVNSTPEYGLTAARPTVNLQIAQIYYDTTLGIPIWWNGTVWKNASGTTV
jgi:hypothetical protein